MMCKAATHEPRNPPQIPYAPRLAASQAWGAASRWARYRLYRRRSQDGLVGTEGTIMAEDASELAVRYLGTQGFHRCTWRIGGDIPEVCLCAPSECQARGVRAPVLIRFPVPFDGGSPV